MIQLTFGAYVALVCFAVMCLQTLEPRARYAAVVGESCMKGDQALRRAGQRQQREWSCTPNVVAPDLDNLLE